MFFINACLIGLNSKQLLYFRNQKHLAGNNLINLFISLGVDVNINHLLYNYRYVSSSRIYFPYYFCLMPMVLVKVSKVPKENSFGSGLPPPPLLKTIINCLSVGSNETNLCAPFF